MGLLTSARYYRAVIRAAPEIRRRVWVEADGRFVCRQFATEQDSTFVAPHDMEYLDEGHPDCLSKLGEIVACTLLEFESLWEELAQARLRVLAVAEPNAGPYTKVGSALYIKSPFPAEFKGRNEATSAIYTEWAEEVPRRSFEVFPDHTEVTPYDATWPGNYAMWLKAVEEGVDDQGAPIPAGLRPVRIMHDEFEIVWEAQALPRFRQLAFTDSY